jgi:hypothetical protein
MTIDKYGEPWKVLYQIDYPEPPEWPYIANADGENVAILPKEKSDQETLERITLCVNACAGLSDEHIHKFMECRKAGVNLAELAAAPETPDVVNAFEYIAAKIIQHLFGKKCSVEIVE